MESINSLKILLEMENQLLSDLEESVRSVMPKTRNARSQFKKMVTVINQAVGKNKLDTQKIDSRIKAESLYIRRRVKYF